jgi:tRNA pseudouridine38-40 synthase
MREAAAFIIGTHDFKCFETSGGTPRETTVRTVSALDISEDDNSIVIEITGDGFLYNMVRIITGTLVEAGAGKRTPESVRDAIESRNRANAGFTAPPQGLYLKEIYFE